MKEQESYYGFDEMFISMTDLRGIIISGNDVFVRVSGYPKSRIINAPHNIIRHPDMPKVVFKLLWDTIQARKPISAYVKNRSIDGKFYWVVANVLPTSENYLSVRFKPSSAIFDLIPSLYDQMLEIERTQGMEGSGAFLFEQLKKLGFDSYDQFMTKMLEEELKSKQIKINENFDENQPNNKNSFTDSKQYVYHMKSISEVSVGLFKRMFEQLDEFNQINVAMQKTSQIVKVCEQLEYLSLNMSVMSNKLGKEGPSLSVISSAFQKSSREVSDRFKKFTTSVQEMEIKLQKIRYDISFCRTYIEMLTFFTQEVLSSPDFEKNLVAHMRDFTKIINSVQSYFAKTIELQGEVLQAMKEFKYLTDMLKSVVMSLDLIRMGGKLEGSRTMKTESVFSPYVSEMMKSINSIEVPVTEVGEIVEHLISYLESIRGQLNTISMQMVEMDLIRYRDYKIVAQSVA